MEFILQMKNCRKKSGNNWKLFTQDQLITGAALKYPAMNTKILECIFAYDLKQVLLTEG